LFSIGFLHPPRFDEIHGQPIHNAGAVGSAPDCQSSGGIYQPSGENYLPNIGLLLLGQLKDYLD